MATDLKANDKVYVPNLTASNYDGSDHPSHIEATVESIKTSRVYVRYDDGSIGFFKKADCHRNLGILILTIGDLESEKEMLDSLKESIFYNLKLLLSEKFIECITVRSVNEISAYWQINHSRFSDVIIVGHGNKESIYFAMDQHIKASCLMSAFDIGSDSKTTFINLSCASGNKSFGGIASSFDFCESFIGPKNNVYVPIASQFVQMFFTFRFLDGKRSFTAFSRARKALISSSVFSFWKSGKENRS